jgi:hypothetical protein
LLRTCRDLFRTNTFLNKYINFRFLINDCSSFFYTCPNRFLFSWRGHWSKAKLFFWIVIWCYILWIYHWFSYCCFFLRCFISNFLFYFASLIILSFWFIIFKILIFCNIFLQYFLFVIFIFDAQILITQILQNFNLFLWKLIRIFILYNLRKNIYNSKNSIIQDLSISTTNILIIQIFFKIIFISVFFIKWLYILLFVIILIIINLLLFRLLIIFTFILFLNFLIF